MQTAFRWYGPGDRVPLAWIRQMTPTPLVVTHLGEIAPGALWSLDALQALRASLEAHGLKLGPVESLFWSDAMKLGKPERDQHIANYIASMQNLRAVFSDVPDLIVTYHLMALDWGRTHLAWEHPNGARGLAFEAAAWDNLDLSKGLYLPGWGKAYSKQEYETLVADYATLGEGGLWSNLKYALDAIVPAAEQLGIRLAAHPNDPPWGILGLPAVLTDSESIRRFLALSSSPAHGLCFCTGSYGAHPSNDVLAMLREFKERITWLHLRTVKTTGEKTFHEADHADEGANVSLFKVVQTLVELGWEGTFRSDHGLDLLNETELEMRGYPAIDRYVANKMIWAYWRGLKER